MIYVKLCLFKGKMFSEKINPLLYMFNHSMRQKINLACSYRLMSDYYYCLSTRQYNFLHDEKYVTCQNMQKGRSWCRKEFLGRFLYELMNSVLAGWWGLNWSQWEHMEFAGTLIMCPKITLHPQIVNYLCMDLSLIYDKMLSGMVVLIPFVYLF